MFFWKTSKLTILVTAVILVQFSCKKKNTHADLYNIDSLISSQVNFLSAKNATLNKTAVISGAVEDSTLTRMDSASWSRELDIFRTLSELNQPASKGSYLIDDNLYDVSSNLIVKAFSLRDATNAGDLPVQYLRVFYRDDIAALRKVEALYKDENPLFKSGRLFTMEFSHLEGKSVLTSYSILGGQKMALDDTLTFAVKGKIVIE